MWVRMSIFQGSPNQSNEEIEQNNKTLQERILPTARQMDGFKGAMTIGDRVSGKGISLTFWETEEAMKASEEAANKLRQQSAEETNDQIAGVERYEVFIYEPPQEG